MVYIYTLSRFFTLPMTKTQVKILFFADTHLGFDFPLRPRLKIRRRGQDFFNNFHKIMTYAENRRPDFLVHGGDLFFRSRVAPSIVDKVYKAFFDFVEKTGIPIFIVPGNHERSYLPQSLYLAHPLINVFNRPRYFTLKKDDIKVTLYGFPFYRGDIRTQFKYLLKQCGWNKSLSSLQLLVLHQAVDGAQVGPSDYTFKYNKDVIDIRDIPANIAAVLSGHIHRRQILYSDKVPVIYPGSIERTSFAEKNEQKGFYEIDFAPDTNENKHWIVEKIKFLRLAARPMADIYLNGLHSKSAIEKSIMKQCADLAQDSIVRLRQFETSRAGYSPVNLSFIRSILPSSFSVQMDRFNSLKT